MANLQSDEFMPAQTIPATSDAGQEEVQMRWYPAFQVSHRQTFVDLARKAVTLRPDLFSAYETLGGLLLATGRYEEAVQALSKAMTEFPSEPKLYLMLADAYLRSRQASLAWSVLQQIPVTQGNDLDLSIDHLTLSLRALERLKVIDDAATVAAELLKIDPVNDDALQYLAHFSRTKNNPEIMLELCEAALAHQPGHTVAHYELALTYAFLGRSDEARAMMDLHQFVKIADLAKPPPGYRDALEFQDAVSEEIESDPTLKPDPPDTSTEGGFHTDYFLPHSDEQASISDLISVIKAEVASYVANLGGARSVPFIEGRPKEVTLNAWAIVHPSKGRQAPHIHPGGWLSGVYYVGAPSWSRQGVRAGSLVLGAVGEGLKLDPPWGIREISPAPGRLVLFPSYIPHATKPSGSPEKRVCVAFDVIPCS